MLRSRGKSEGCGDYVLQVKDNQKGVLRQCEELSRIRPLVDSSKKKN